MKRLFIGCLIFAAVTTSANAQNASEIYKISQQNGGYSSARSSALGGAFTSLGADVTSISSNPAGLGMYMSSEISVTPSLQITATSSSADNGNSILDSKSRSTKGALNNLGAVYTFRNENRGLRNVSIGISYNSFANNNSRFTNLNQASDISIADMFSAQLFGVNPKDMNGGMRDYDNFSPGLYGAVGAYKTGLVFDVADNPYRYAPSYDDASGNPVGSLLAGDIVYPELTRKTEGVGADYNIAIGTSIKDILYLGMTLGVSDYGYRQFDDYFESAATSNRGDLGSVYYNQSLYQNGTAFNFIIGATLQPVKGLRIGASYQAPKVYTISEEYSTYQENYFLANDGSFTRESSASPILYSDYKIKTPSRMSIGLSYALANIGLITVDYERVWYNKMSVSGIQYMPGDITIDQEISRTYNAANNIKAGIEANIYHGTFVRAGYALYDNANKLIDKKYGKVENFSGGIGYRTSGFFIDLTYVMVKSESLPYRFFDYDDILRSNAVNSTTFRKHNLILTAGVKF